MSNKNRWIRMRNHLVLIISTIVIGVVLCSGCFSSPDPVYKPDVSTTKLKIDYTGPVTTDYGTYDCFRRTDIMAPKEIPFKGFNCRMDYASFGKPGNDTQTAILKMDLVHNGQVIKSYSSSTSSIRFNKIPEFLVRSSQEPGLVLDTPVTAKIIVDGQWSGWLADAFGTQYERGTGPASLTLVQPVSPVEACVESKAGAGVTPPPVVELYRGNTFLKRSGDTKNTIYNMYCVTYP